MHCTCLGEAASSKLSGLNRGIIPHDYPLLTAAVDVGKAALHWCVMAWSEDGSGAVIDYGVQCVRPTNRYNDQAVELAISQALHELRDQLLSADYNMPDGQILPIRVCLVDSGWKADTVYEFVRNTGGQVFAPSKCFSVTTVGRESYCRARVGDHCFSSPIQDAAAWLVKIDSDYWKSRLHQWFMTPYDQPWPIVIFGNDKRNHASFAYHWFDTTYMASAAASLRAVFH